jgi:hypothetical protein
MPLGWFTRLTGWPEYQRRTGEERGAHYQAKGIDFTASWRWLIGSAEQLPDLLLVLLDQPVHR